MLIYRVFQMDNCHLEHFKPFFVRGQIGLEGVVEEVS